VHQAHAWEQLLREEKRSIEVNVYNATPFCKVGFDTLVFGKQACIVHQDRDSPEASEDGVAHFLNRRGGRDINSKGMETIGFVVEASSQSRQALGPIIQGSYEIPLVK